MAAHAALGGPHTDQFDRSQGGWPECWPNWRMSWRASTSVMCIWPTSWYRSIYLQASSAPQCIGFLSDPPCCTTAARASSVGRSGLLGTEGSYPC